MGVVAEVFRYPGDRPLALVASEPWMIMIVVDQVVMMVAEISGPFPFAFVADVRDYPVRFVAVPSSRVFT
jgi:hypothetical protein